MADPTILSKVVFPGREDPDVAPLYVDVDEWTEFQLDADADNPSEPIPFRVTHRTATTLIDGRRSLNVPDGDRVSLATYFNAFPASYWRRWTSLTGVRLRVQTSGPGDVVVYRSNARGVVQTVETAHVDSTTVSEFDLGFDNFLDGGWYWFDLVSRGEGFRLEQADWIAPETATPTVAGSLTVSITTLNRAPYCLGVLEALAGDADALAGIDRITVIDQGTDTIRSQADYPRIAELLGDRLQVIEQANVGGSGGFSRGMLEAVRADRSDFLMLLDDDVVVDPESVRRAQQFARFCEQPTIVGGHMFDMYDKTKLHAYAESVESWNFNWGPVTPARHDFTALNLRQTPWIHRRFDVDYNGWWMSLIPVSIIREIGLSLPVFIKWDDAEYSLRASAHGHATVSFPGAAIWHVSWVDKDDSRDWQAFYHARNRLVAALAHSPHARGGRLPIANLANDLRHLLTMDYGTVALRQLAYDSVLAGPESLHAELATRLPEIRRTMADHRETALQKDIRSIPHFPTTLYFGEDPATDTARPRGLRIPLFLLKTLGRHWFARVPVHAADRPEAHVPHASPWWRLVGRDSFVMSNAEGSGVTWHVRDRALFRSLLLGSIRRNLRIRRRWASLSERYRRQLPTITSLEAWSSTLGLDGSNDGTH